MLTSFTTLWQIVQRLRDEVIITGLHGQCVTYCMCSTLVLELCLNHSLQLSVWKVTPPPEPTWLTLTAGIGTGVCCSAAGGVTVVLLELAAPRGSFLGAVFPLGGLLRGLGGFWCSREGEGNRTFSIAAGLLREEAIANGIRFVPLSKALLLLCSLTMTNSRRMLRLRSGGGGCVLKWRREKRQREIIENSVYAAELVRMVKARKIKRGNNRGDGGRREQRREGSLFFLLIGPNVKLSSQFWEVSGQTEPFPQQMCSVLQLPKRPKMHWSLCWVSTLSDNCE